MRHLEILVEDAAERDETVRMAAWRQLEEFPYVSHKSRKMGVSLGTQQMFSDAFWGYFLKNEKWMRKETKFSNKFHLQPSLSAFSNHTPPLIPSTTPSPFWGPGILQSHSHLKSFALAVSSSCNAFYSHETRRCQLIFLSSKKPFQITQPKVILPSCPFSHYPLGCLHNPYHHLQLFSLLIC